MKRRSDIATRVERAEINAIRIARRRPARVQRPAEDPGTMDTSSHDARCRTIYSEFGLMALHPQDKRLSEQLRLLLKLEYWKILRGKQ